MNNNNPDKLLIGFSPCPNDTFIFDAMVHNKVDTEGLQFEYILEDVETLNLWALEGKLPITKLSFNTFLQVSDQYVLLDSGSALGRGVGPLLISKNEKPEADFEKIVNQCKIAIPGKNTTANLLFSLAFPNAQNKQESVFSEIESTVLSGGHDLGLIIHENRFTYYERGLHKWMDMGDWWEAQTGAAIPLGGICVRRDIASELAKKIEQLIAQSIDFSFRQYPELSDFVRSNAQEMNEDVMRKHIELYVNDFSRSLGDEGRMAIDKLFELAVHHKLTEQPQQSVYLK